MDTKSPSKNEPFKRSELKKNPKVDVARNSSIYFAVGLALMLFLTYSTLNYKTYDKSNIDIGKLNLDNELDEEIPVIEQVAPPPPPSIPPPIAPQVIEVVEDEDEVEETDDFDEYLKSIGLEKFINKFKENGYDLEMTPEIYNAEGEFYKYDLEHKRPLAISLYSDSFNNELIIFLLRLGSKPNNYETSNCTIIPTLKNNYPVHEILYQLIKHGADVNQAYHISRGNKKIYPIDLFKSTYKNYLSPDAYKYYSKEIVHCLILMEL